LKINLITLGCPKNLVDSEFLQNGLKAHRAEFVSTPEQADAIIVNTCGFIEPAKEESIDTILAAVELKKRGSCRQVFVTGCLSERHGPELQKEIPEVDGFYGNRDLRRIVAGLALQMHLKHELLGESYLDFNRELLTPKHYAYLKISEGCEHPCTFCTIPQIRGRFRSTPIPELVREAWQLPEQGVKELILIAQDSTQYGLDLTGTQLLPQLLRQLCEVEGIEWIRLMYAYPYHLNDEIIEVVATEPKIVNYVDMPIQHISDRMLRRMARRVDRRFTEALIERLHRKIPGLVLRTSLIVGFPGETDEDFQDLLDFVSEGHVQRVGVFTYSREESTPASAFRDQVPIELKRERHDLLMQAQHEVAAKWSAGQVGSELRVLIDEHDASQGLYRGRTEWDCPEIDHTVLVRPGLQPLSVGEFCQIHISQAQDFDLIGTPERERNSALCLSEHVALVNAIKEGETAESVSREEVFSILDGKL